MVDLETVIKAVAKTLGSDFGARIFFLHVPKCGGTSLFHSIRNCYNFLERYRGIRQLTVHASFRAATVFASTSEHLVAKDDYQALVFGESKEVLEFGEPLLLYFMSQRSSKFVTGHFAFSEPAYRAFHTEFTFLTMLRDPVRRWISDYNYNRYATRKTSSDLLDYIKTDYARSQGSEIVKYIGGVSEEGDYVSPQAVERAKRNLEKFDIVGCLEHQEDFCLKFKERFAVRLKLPTLNESRVSNMPPPPPIDKEIESEIREICKPDLEVYRWAVERFVKR